MQADPYAPPASSVAGPTPAEAGALRYSGFWQRVGAYFIDALIVLPVTGIDYLFGGSTHLFPLYMLIPGQCIALFLHVFMVYKYGATPGKMALGLRVAMADGAPVTLPATLLRYSVLWLIGISSAIAIASAALKTHDATWSTLSYMQRSQELVANAPGWFVVVKFVSGAWIIAVVITMLANRQRRSVHDFIAGTAVVRKK
ncbi:MAG TPA: RDD family protein [Telluria sp.]|nr:RDD family protein [Telluria sp.]